MYLEVRGEEVFEEPELDGSLGVTEDRHHHDAQEPLVQMTRCHGEDVDCLVLIIRGSS